MTLYYKFVRVLFFYSYSYSILVVVAVVAVAALNDVFLRLVKRLGSPGGGFKSQCEESKNLHPKLTPKSGSLGAPPLSRWGVQMAQAGGWVPWILLTPA